MPGAHRKRVVETSDYVAMLQRMFKGYSRRLTVDPAGLSHLRDLETGLRDAVNLAIYEASHAVKRPYSLTEIAAILGVSVPAIHKRAKLGEAIADQLTVADGTIRLADLRKARAARLASLGLADRTGSERERAVT